MRCHLCSDDLEHCHEISIEHIDGSTECSGDEPCGLAHHLHDWAFACAELDPPCACDVTSMPRSTLPIAA